MEIIERKPNRTLWRGTDPEGRTTYEWTTNQDGVPYEPQSCTFCSKLAAQQVWRANNKSLSPGRPRTLPEGVKPSEGRPLMSVRLPPEVTSWVASQGGLRSVVLAAYNERR